MLIPLFFCRNHSLADKGLKLPKATSTGTTIVGCLFNEGIILGADTRATEGPIVADKNCEKVNVDHPVPVISRTLLPADPLHHRVDPVLWCRNSRRHDIFHSSYLIQHGNARFTVRTKASRGDRDDDVKADALSVCH